MSQTLLTFCKMPLSNAKRNSQKISFEDESPTSDEENDSESPIYDSFCNEGGSEAILKMTKFSAGEFDFVWNSIRKMVVQTWNIGRGKKFSFKLKDVLFMLLTVLTHSRPWNFMENIFNIKGPAFERLTMKFLTMTGVDVCNDLVATADSKYTMKRIMRNNNTFGNFKYARYARDVTFQQWFRPSGNLAQGKKCFSGKHRLHGYRVEVSVLPNGIAFSCSQNAPGPISDIDIFFIIWIFILED